MHDPVRQTGEWLKSVVQGYFNYYAVPGKHRQHETIPASTVGALVAHSVPSKPATRALGEDAWAARPVASRTPRAPSLSRGSLRRQSSEIRTGCANERPSGSVRGVPRKRYPYRDRAP